MGPRELTDHIVSGDQAVQLKIEVTDEPGAGGANHRYEISGFTSVKPTILPTIEELEAILKSNDNQAIPMRPDGSVGIGLANLVIEFQNGPIKEAGVNGITQEALLAIVIDRLKSFQAGPFACEANQEALQLTRRALSCLQERTKARIARGVEGTNIK